MKLDFIPLASLSVSRANMRHGKRPPDVGDILPSVRARGVLVPVLVRAGGSTGSTGGTFEIVAGRRRFHAALAVAAERPDDAGAAMLPCAIIDDNDDAAAVEASLIENLARLDPDEVAQWETFVRLTREGRTPADIAATFGLAGSVVRRILALGNLLPRIRSLYRQGDIDTATIRHLTLATKRQQQAWLALLDDPQSHAPTGERLRAWLLGGAAIPADHALFDVDASGLAIAEDLFRETRWFADADAFWTAQNAAVAARADAYRAAGWQEVVILGPDTPFQSWEHEKCARRKGGRVYIDVRRTGEVVFHEGYITRREATRLRGGGADTAPAPVPRAEISKSLRAYLDLHRHAAVRAVLTAHPGAALRLMLAHAVCGSTLWSVRREPQTAPSEAIAESVETSAAETAFDSKRRAVLDVLGLDADCPSVVGAYGVRDLPALFLRLTELPDGVVLDILAVVMGETLAAGDPVIAALGLHLGIDMADWWQADDAVLGLVRDKSTLSALVAEVAGKTIADANHGAAGKGLRAILADHLSGSNGRPHVTRWVPRWMRFPASRYAEAGPAPVAADAPNAETTRLAA